jgi:DNA (cytosine-5)-methyltransferase 1
MTVGSLCSGLGGFEYGFQLASPSFQIKWQVEIDPFCRKVLAKHWPDVKRYEDLTTLTGDELEPVDLVCAGFPCQPVSVAGLRKAQADERWIWPHIARLVGVLRPRWVVLENTPGLFTANGGHAFGEVIGDLAALGFDCEYETVSAQDVGAFHLRKRVWIVAYSKQPGDPTHGSVHRRDQGEPAGNARASVSTGTEVAHAEDTQSGGTYVAHADGCGCNPTAHPGGTLPPPSEKENRKPETQRVTQAANHRRAGTTNLADAGCESERPESIGSDRERFHGDAEGVWSATGDRSSDGCKAPRRIFDGEIGGEWEPEPNVGRVAHGVPNRVDRLKGLGNAIVPQIAEWIGRRIIEVER